MANGKLGVAEKITFLDTIKDAAHVYLGFLETEVDFTESYGELDVSDEIALKDVAGAFDTGSSNVSGSLVRLANDDDIVTAGASAGDVTLTGWFLATTNTASDAKIIAMQNFTSPITTTQGIPIAFAVGDLKVELD